MPTLAPSIIAIPELLAKIQSSLMGDEQKKALLDVLPRATETDRAQILALIDKSNAEAEGIQKDYEVHVGDINMKYKQKLDELVRVKTRRARETFETMDEEKKVQTMMTLEQELQNVKDAPLTSAVPTLAHHTSRHSSLVALIFFLILGLLAFGAWLALKML
ncbi:hypothetical protein HZA43_03945 [Candidatus Peregrinibacteria bacterium]|nr:hypothetical protein [Candidatus Peregrinibacteria bacterium]